MLRELKCSSEVLALFDRSEPLFFNSIRFELDKRLPLVSLRLFSFKTDDGEYFFACQQNKVIQPHVMTTYKGTYNTKEFLEGVEEFLREMNLFNQPRKILFIGKDHLIQDIYNHLSSKLGGFHFRLNPCLEFILSAEQEKYLKNLEPPAHPDGYEIGDADPADAEFMTSLWKYADEGEVENTRQKISCFPSSAVRYLGETVGFVTLDTKGCLTHHYVLEEHRRKGLGAALEIDILKKSIRDGIAAYKNVEQSNPSVIAASKKSGYWTLAKNSDGSDFIKTYLQLTPS